MIEQGWRDHAWRVVATGLSFAAFGIGGLVLRLAAFPVLQLCVRDPARRCQMARRWVQRSFAAHIGLMERLGVLTYRVQGGERLQRQGLLILSNHPTLIDVVFLVSMLPNADCVIKGALARNPFMRGPVRAAGYITNDGGPALVGECIAAIRGGGNLVIFPEGTRTSPGRPPCLQRGAANVAIRGRFDITPVRIRCEPATLEKGQKWYRVPSQRFHVSIEVGEDLPVAPYLDGIALAAGSESRAVRRLTDDLARYFSGE